MHPSNGTKTLSATGLPSMTIVINGDVATGPLGESFIWDALDDCFVSQGRNLTIQWTDSTHITAVFGSPIVNTVYGNSTN